MDGKLVGNLDAKTREAMESFFADDPRVEKEPRMIRYAYRCEAEPERNDEGVKFDQGKLRMELLPPDALEALARILTDGAVKYNERNWEKGMSWSRPYAALLRHLLAFWRGQDIDPESGHPHLWHVLCNAVFLTSYQIRSAGKDDRP